MGTRRRAELPLARLLALLLAGTAFAAEPAPAVPPRPLGSAVQAPPVLAPPPPVPTPVPAPSPAVPPSAPLPASTTAYVPVPQFPGPPLAPVTSERPFIIDLQGERREAGQYFNLQMRERRQAFEVRQAQEETDFEADQEGKGFWERRRLKRAFQAEQRRQRKAFNAEDDDRRKKTGWRFE